MSPPTEPPRDELRTLRERAYGPAADIHDDPAALARLHELETQAAGRRRAPEPPAGDGAETRVPEGVDAGTPAPERAALAGDAPAPAPAPPREATAAAADRTTLSRDRPWWRRRTRVLWAGSLVAAMLVGAGLTLGVQALQSGRVASLLEDPDAEWPEQFGGPRPPDSRLFESFHGLAAVTGPDFFGSTGGSQTCLYILDTGSGGFAGGGCGAGPYAATVTVQVAFASPRELRERFPDGTALRFVLEEPYVHVYAHEPGAGEPTP